MLPDVYLLQQFSAVMENGSYTEAARQMHLSRQALTKNIQKMEAMLGTPLFQARGKRLVPTDFARLLDRHARPVLQAWKQFETAMEAESSRQWLSLSLSQGIATSLGTNPYEVFLGLHPEIHLVAEEASCDEVLSRVDSGEAQIGLLGTHPDYLEGFDHLCLRHTGVWLLLPQDHPLARKEELCPTDLAHLPVCGSGRHNHLQRFFIEGCKSEGITPSFSLIATYPDKAGAAPEKGIYFSMPPGISPVPEGWTIRHLLLPREEAFGTYVICKKERPLSPMARSFWTFLLERYVRS